MSVLDLITWFTNTPTQPQVTTHEICISGVSCIALRKLHSRVSHSPEITAYTNSEGSLLNLTTFLSLLTFMNFLSLGIAFLLGEHISIQREQLFHVEE